MSLLNWRSPARKFHFKISSTRKSFHTRRSWYPTIQQHNVRWHHTSQIKMQDQCRQHCQHCQQTNLLWMELGLEFDGWCLQAPLSAENELTLSFDGLASALSADAVVSHIRGTEISSLHGRNHLLYCYIETSQGKLLRNLQLSEMLNRFSRGIVLQAGLAIT